MHSYENADGSVTRSWPVKCDGCGAVVVDPEEKDRMLYVSDGKGMFVARACNVKCLWDWAEMEILS